MDNIELKITMSPSGQVQVTGPIQNKMLCYGMLEAAKDAVRDFVNQNQSVIIPARVIPGNGN